MCLDRDFVLFVNRLPKVAKRNNGIESPMVNAMIIKIMAVEICCEAAKVAIVAKIGPAHGVHTIPNVNPVAIPETKPFEFLFVMFENFELKIVIALSNSSMNFGIISESPKNSKTTTAKYLKIIGLNENILRK